MKIIQLWNEKGLIFCQVYCNVVGEDITFDFDEPMSITITKVTLVEEGGE